MSDRAAVAFVGRVTAVRRVPGKVEIEFHVEQVVRGCSAGDVCAARVGWALGGERCALPSGTAETDAAPCAGSGRDELSVDGLDGALPVYGAGPEGDLVDLRWVGTKLQRPVVYAAAAAPVAVQGAGSVVVTASSAVGIASNSAPAMASNVPQSSIPAQAAGISLVVGLLRGWSPAADEVSGAAH